MREAFGDFAYCAKASHDFLETLQSKGHEIGWHPHLWRWKGKWLAELEDKDFVRNCLLNGFNSMRDQFEITSVRTGWNSMSNGIMETLESLGILADFSANPGYMYKEDVLGISADWREAPTGFYFPSREDYRRPAQTSDGAFKVLEMPVTLTKTPRAVRWARWFVDRYRKASRWPNQYEAINIAKHPMFNRNGFESAFNKRNGDYCKHIVTSFHPIDVVNERLSSNQWGLMSMQNLEHNVKYLLTRCKEEKIQLKTMTAAEVAEDYLRTHNR